jgi:hypothetical protein
LDAEQVAGEEAQLVPIVELVRTVAACEKTMQRARVMKMATFILFRGTSILRN